jgi:hypothetical protein
MLTLASFIRCCVGVGGLIFVWAGTWVLYDEYTVDTNDVIENNLLLMFLGTIVLLVTQTFLARCGMPVNTKMSSSQAASVWFRLWWFLKWTVSLFGIILVWVGLYNILDMGGLDNSSTWLKNVVYSIYVFCGLVIRALVQNIPISILDTPRTELDWNALDSYNKIFASLRACLGCFGAVTAWVGIDHLLIEYNEEEQYLGPKLVSIALGILLMTVTYTIPQHAGVEDIDWTKARVGSMKEGLQLLEVEQDAEGNHLLQKYSEYDVPSYAYYNKCSRISNKYLIALRAMIGQLGFYLFWSGIQAALFFYAPVSIPSDLTWVLMGLLCMWIGRCLVPGTTTMQSRSPFAQCLPSSHTPGC